MDARRDSHLHEDLGCDCEQFDIKVKVCCDGCKHVPHTVFLAM